MAEAQSADAYSTDDATQADELEMEVVARLAKEGQATIPSFIEDAAFWVGLGQHAGFLLACLRARDFNEEKAVLVAQNFARFRAKMKWSNVLLAAMVEGALRQNVFWLLPQKDRTGRAVLIFNMRYMDLRLCSLMEYQQAGAYLMQTAIASRQTQERGVTVIMDLHETSMTLLRSLNQKDVKRAVSMWQDAFPCKIGRIFVLNLGTVTARICKSALGFLNKKTQSRIVFLAPKKVSVLHAVTPKALLPKTLGGDADMDSYWCMYVEQQLQNESEARQQAYVSAAGQRGFSCWGA